MKISVKNLKREQRGVVAIIVTVIIMVLISLIVLTLSQNANREQRQSLDRQLSDQAFYNAESGINDTAAFLYKNPSAPLDNKDDCDPVDTTTSAPSRNVDETNKYTCVLYDKAPTQLYYDSLSISAPRVIPIESYSAAGLASPIARLTIAWDDSSDKNASISGACSFSDGGPDLPTSCSHGGVRSELIVPGTSRDQIQKSSFIAYLLPNASSGSDLSVVGKSYPDNQGIISATRCNYTGPDVRRCSKTITDINRNNFMLGIRSLYRPVNVTISAVDASGNPLRLNNAQTMIDSTGRANDVLRRVQVRIPAKSQYDYPGFGMLSKDSICKVISVAESSPGVGSANSDDNTRCPIN